MFAAFARHGLLTAAALVWLVALPALADEEKPDNLFANASFEEGRDGWHLDRAAKTDARLALETAGGAVGPCCMRVSINSVEGYGTQFGQSLPAPAVGKTYTFAVLVKPAKGPVPMSLQIERRGKPYDRAAAGKTVTVAGDRWTEIHVTFKLDKPFPQGWFAYIECSQPKCEYLADLFRLYEGPYVPYQEAARKTLLAHAVNVFDTGSAAAQPLTPAAVAKQAGWNKLPEDQTEHRFAGDAVLASDRLALVLRRGAPGAELYAKGPAGFALRAVLSPRPCPGAKLQSVAIAENSPGESAVEAVFHSAEGQSAAVSFELAMGQIFVRTEPRAGTKALAVDVPCRFLVLPDFFADDIVIDAADIPLPAADLPSENFVLHLVPGGQSMVMTVANDRQQEARVQFSGQGPGRQATSSEIAYGQKGKVWVAVLEGRGIWHHRDVSQAEAGKIVPLEWKAPYPAQWRVDWRQADRLTGSWEMILEQPNGEFEKPGWLGSGDGDIPANRSRWNTVLGRFSYPCWIDRSCQGHLQPMKSPKVAFEGPAVIYPINRVRATSPRQHTVVDVVRATLGVGPCEYVLDVEGQGATMKGRATCATRDSLKKIYTAGEQRQRRAEVEQILQEVVVFVTHIRSRIDQYVAFGQKTAAWLAVEKRTHPELAGFIGEMETLARTIGEDFEHRKDKIHTPQYVIDLTQEFRRNVMDFEGPDAYPRCKKITEAIVVVGGNQDELVGECRRDVKLLRQRAALAMALNPKAAPLANEIRRRTQEVLRNSSSYEAPRH